MSLTTVQKVSKSGNSLVINIPKKIVDIMDIEISDYIEIIWGNIIKSKEELKKKKIIVKNIKKLPEL